MHYVPGREREMFEVKGVPFAISICHEGWRYPETVRWGAVRGAAVVFHPHHAGNEVDGVTVESFAAASSPYFEKAMMCRALEDAVYFASVGYALRYQEAATALISPEGRASTICPMAGRGCCSRISTRRRRVASTPGVLRRRLVDSVQASVNRRVQ